MYRGTHAILLDHTHTCDEIEAMKIAMSYGGGTEYGILPLYRVDCRDSLVCDKK